MSKSIKFIEDMFGMFYINLFNYHDQQDIYCSGIVFLDIQHQDSAQLSKS